MREFGARYGAYGFEPTAWGCSYGLAENCVYVAGTMERPATLQVRRGLWAGDVAWPAEEGDGALFECPGCFFQPEWRTHQSVRIVHPDSLEEMADGTVGEIWVGGRSVARGYWDLPEVSRHTFGAQLAEADGPVHMRSGELRAPSRGDVWDDTALRPAYSHRRRPWLRVGEPVVRRRREEES